MILILKTEIRKVYSYLFVEMREHKCSKQELMNTLLYLIENSCK